MAFSEYLPIRPTEGAKVKFYDHKSIEWSIAGDNYKSTESFMK